MKGISHLYGGDLSVSATGDLLLADPSTTGTQRVYRRLLTNPQLQDATGNVLASPDYTWHPTYGAGVPRKVGAVTDIGAITALIRGQMLKEAAVARAPAPQIRVAPINNGVNASIQYNDALSKTPQLLSFNVNQ